MSRSFETSAAKTPWWIAVTGFAALYLPVYWWAVLGMVDVDGRRTGIWQSEEQGHGALILLVMIWLFWGLRGRIDAAPTRPAPRWGWPLVATGLLLYVVGQVVGISIFMFGSQPFIVAGMLLLLRGPDAIRVAWFPLLFFIFMLPLPGILVDTITAPLKQWISVIVVELLYRLGYSISRNGVILMIGQYQMQVADACSGLHSMYSLSALGTLFMYIMARRSKLHNAIMLASILPIAFVANLVRVIALVLITYYFGDAAGRGFLHGAAGIVLMLVALVFFFALDAMLERLLGPSDPPVPAAALAGSARGVRMQLKSTAWILATLMYGAAIAGVYGKPTGTREDVIDLETAVPKQFGEWTELREQSGRLVNPQTEELLRTLYSQILTRTYVNKQGYRIMLSIAYGDDQRGGLQAHRPEVCYPAQGFKVLSLEDRLMPTSFGDIDVRRLTTIMGPRDEPVTYWLAVGDHVIRNRFEKRLMEFRLALTGQIPDGLLFRISSIDKESERAFWMQQQFVADLMTAVPAKTRRQLSGLGTPFGAI